MAKKQKKVKEYDVISRNIKTIWVLDIDLSELTPDQLCKLYKFLKKNNIPATMEITTG